MYLLKLDSINSVKRFVSATITWPCNADLVSGRHRVDVKSIMGIFSLDLTNPVELVFDDTVDIKTRIELIKTIKEFLVDDAD